MFICLYLRLKKDNLLTADDKGLTLIHADAEKRELLAVGGTTLNRKTDINDGATGIDIIHLR